MFPLARRPTSIGILAFATLVICAAGAGCGGAGTQRGQVGGGVPAGARGNEASGTAAGAGTATGAASPAVPGTMPAPAASAVAVPVPPEPRQPGLGNARPGDVIRSVTTTRKLIALTFDDGPSKDALPKILAALASVRAQGTFFEVGDRSIGHGDLLREIVASGSELGDHSWDHQEVDKVASTSAIERSISRTQQRMLDVTGVTPVLFRPPAGHYDGRLPGIAASDGLAVALWSLHSGDTNGDSAAKITRTVLGGARPGAIVLMHETAPHTVEALPGIVRALKARGYRMVTVSRLLAAGEPR